MSDGIREVSNAQRSTMNALTRKNKAEVEQIKRLHSLNVNEIKKSQDSDLHLLRETHQLDVAQEVQKKEETLLALRKSQEETQRLTETETKRQQAHALQQREDIRQRKEAEIAKINIAQSETTEDLTARHNESIRDIHQGQRDQLHDVDSRHRVTMHAESDQWRTRIEDQRTKFQGTYNVEGQKYERLTTDQKKKNETQALNNHREHEAKMSQMNNQQVQHEEKVKTHHQKSLQDKEVFFEKKYQGQLAQHTQSNKILEDLNQKVLATAKDDINKRVEVEKNRATDPFFSFTEMRPKLEEKPDSYVLRIEMPEYSKEEVSASANGKEIVLTSNRRYQDERQDADGTVKKVNKVESMVSRIPVGQVLDPRKMEKNWVEGALVFTFKKA
jgi:hypothetical protein